MSQSSTLIKSSTAEPYAEASEVRVAMDDLEAKIGAGSPFTDGVTSDRLTLNGGIQLSPTDSWFAEDLPILYKRGLFFDLDYSVEEFSVYGPILAQGEITADDDSGVLANVMEFEVKYTGTVSSTGGAEVTGIRGAVERNEADDIADEFIYLTGSAVAVNQDAAAATVTDEGIGYGCTMKIERGEMTAINAFYAINILGINLGS